MLIISISEKNRLSGYFTWSAAQEKPFNVMMLGLDSVRVVWCGVDLGVKPINRKTRRIHIGMSNMNSIDPAHRQLKVKRKGDALVVESE